VVWIAVFLLIFSTIYVKTFFEKYLLYFELNFFPLQNVTFVSTFLLIACMLTSLGTCGSELRGKELATSEVGYYLHANSECACYRCVTDE